MFLWYVSSVYFLCLFPLFIFRVYFSCLFSAFISRVYFPRLFPAFISRVYFQCLFPVFIFRVYVSQMGRKSAERVKDLERETGVSLEHYRKLNKRKNRFGEKKKIRRVCWKTESNQRRR